ncbi:MAG: DUF5615 family PIN-like protein [Cyanobacteriota bacterium]|nr:DUF5615 family PIN-like protein [Cyanobacteriota bacterium]
MKIWVDTQLPPTLANWLSSTFGLEVSALRELSLRDTQDVEVFEAAQDENAVMMTKDSDCIATEPRTLKSRIRLRLLPGASAT